APGDGPGGRRPVPEHARWTGAGTRVWEDEASTITATARPTRPKLRTVYRPPRAVDREDDKVTRWQGDLGQVGNRTYAPRQKLLYHSCPSGIVDTTSEGSPFSVLRPYVPGIAMTGIRVRYIGLFGLCTTAV